MQMSNCNRNCATYRVLHTLNGPLTPLQAHHTIVLSHEVILVGNLKLMTAERGNTHQGFYSYVALEESGKLFLVGIFLDFVRLNTRTPEEAHVRRGARMESQPKSN